MRIATFNANSIRARLDIVLDWLDEKKPDVPGDAADPVKKPPSEDVPAYDDIDAAIAGVNSLILQGKLALAARAADAAIEKFGDDDKWRDLASLASKARDVLNDRKLKESFDIDLARIKELATQGELNAALEKASRVAAHDTLVIIISDFEGADDRTLELTTRMAEHNDLLGLHLYDPIRATPHQAGAVSLTDGQLQISADFNDVRFREKIAADYKQESEELTRTLRKLSAPLLPINTQGDVADQIRKLLGYVPMTGSL